MVSSFSTISFSVAIAAIVLPIRAGRCEATAKVLLHLPLIILPRRSRMSKHWSTAGPLRVTRRMPEK